MHNVNKKTNPAWFRSGILGASALMIVFFMFFHKGQGNDLYDPAGLFLTWQQDPTTTMTIDWHTTPEDADRELRLQYRVTGEDQWADAGDIGSHEFPYSERTIRRVELTGLQPGTTYQFRFGEHSRVYKFRTMPEDIDDEPLRFGAGGDTMHHQEFFEATNRQVMPFDLDFVMIGGDMAYADARPPERQFLRGDPETGERLDEYPRLDEGDNLWYHWFDAYKNTLITEEGRVVPMLLAIGNHEVSGGYYGRDDRRPDDWPEYEQNDEIRQMIAPYFYSLFAFPDQPGYNVLDFGDYMSIVLLDTDHSNPVEGKQTEWLERILSERQDITHIFPNYHVPAYPSNRSFDGRTIVTVRDLWVPLFEEYGVQVAFENHDHTYKRTHPIRNGEISDDGVVYIGDGAWGVVPREVKNKDAWYIKEHASVMHAIIGTIQGNSQYYIMIDSEGERIDSYDPDGMMRDQ